MTFSIAACDRRTGMFGVCISTRFPAVGAVTTFARSRVGAIVTQARANPLLACEGLDLLEEGYEAQEVLRLLVASDHEPQRRQLIVVDAGCGVAVHTGTGADDYRGHFTGDGYGVAGNLLVSEKTLFSMLEAYETSREEALSERLVRSLEAGQAAGGDRRGRQSAALRVVSTEPYPYLDLRVDDHPDPVVELRRVYEVAKVELLPFVDALPTRDNPKVDLGVEIRGALIPADRALSGPKRARLHAVDPEAELSLEEEQTA
jgi:uncharacterized Ntn-hydrolase superfamily protein